MFGSGSGGHSHVEDAFDLNQCHSKASGQKIVPASEFRSTLFEGALSNSPVVLPLSEPGWVDPI